MFSLTQGTVRITDTINFRSRLSQQHAYDLHMLSFNHPIHMEQTAKQQLETSAQFIQQLKGQLFYREWLRQKILSLSAAFIPLFLAKPIVKFVCRYLLRSSLIFTNAGTYPHHLDTYRSFRVDDFLQFSVCLPPGRLAIVLSTFRQHFRLTAVSDEGFLSPEETQKFLKDFAKENGFTIKSVDHLYPHDR
jgi:hypothetical protein